MDNKNKLCPVCGNKGILCGDYNIDKDILDLYIVCENKKCSVRTGIIRVKDNKSKSFIIKRLEKDWEKICSNGACFCDQSFIDIIVDSVCTDIKGAGCKNCLLAKSTFPFCEDDNICKITEVYFSFSKEKQESLWNEYQSSFVCD